MPKSTFFNLPEEKKERIINATLEEFTENKYESVAISNISKKAKIPVGSFYQYFYDKDDLYLYIFFEIDLRIMEICHLEDSKYSDLKLKKDLCWEKYITQKELDFYNTWYFVPDDIMRKFYFGEYDNRIFDICRKQIQQFKDDGKLIDYLDFEFILYIYVTSTFNLYMYCKKNNINDELERLRLKSLFFERMIKEGIFKR